MLSKNVHVKGFVWIRKINKVIDVWRKRCAARNESMSVSGQRLTKTSNVFFSENILFYNIVTYFYIIIIL